MSAERKYETSEFVMKTKTGDRTIKAARVGRLFVHRAMATLDPSGKGPAVPNGWPFPYRRVTPCCAAFTARRPPSPTPN
jgi:hypothetical protein